MLCHVIVIVILCCVHNNRLKYLSYTVNYSGYITFISPANRREELRMYYGTISWAIYNGVARVTCARGKKFLAPRQQKLQNLK